MNHEEKILEMLMEMRSDITEFKTVQTKQGEQLGRMEKQLDQMDERFDQVDERLDQMDERLDQMDERLDQMDKRFDQMDKRLDRMDERLDQMDKRLDQMDERLDELDARSLKSAVLLETEVSRDIHLLYEGHSEMKRKLETLATKEQVNELASDVEVIKKVVSGHSIDIGKLKKAQ